MATEREMVVSLAEDTVEMLDDRHGSDLVGAADRVARKYGIDSGYLQHVLHRDSDNWPKVPGRQEEALKALVSLTDAAFAFNDGKFSLPPVEDEGKVDAAILEMSKWAWEHRKQILQSYFRLIRNHIPGAQEHLLETTGKSWSDRDAMIWLHGALKYTLKNSPAGIWRNIMLYRVLDLIF
jgi:hypothetical protein